MTEIDIVAVQKKINIVLDATVLSAIMTCGRFSDLRFNHQLELATGRSNNIEIGLVAHKILEVYNLLVIAGVNKKEAQNFGLTAGELYSVGCPYCLRFRATYCEQYHLSKSKNWKDCVEDEQAHLKNCINCITKPKCGHKPNEYPGLQNTPEENDKYLIGWKYVIETMIQYFDYYKNDSWICLAAESVKGKIFYEDDNIRILFKSKLDALVDTPNGIRPMDTKTMKQNRDIISLNNQFKGQCINANTREVWINKIGFQKTLPPSEKFIRVPINYSLDALNEFQNEILPYWAYKLLEYKETEYYPPNYTNCDGKYGKCIFVEVCEADRNMRNEILKLNYVVGEEWNPSNDLE